MCKHNEPVTSSALGNGKLAGCGQFLFMITREKFPHEGTFAHTDELLLCGGSIYSYACAVHDSVAIDVRFGENGLV